MQPGKPKKNATTTIRDRQHLYSQKSFKRLTKGKMKEEEKDRGGRKKNLLTTRPHDYICCWDLDSYGDDADSQTSG